MGLEGKITPESTRHERFRLGSLSLDESNKLQYGLAAIAYARHNPDVDMSNVAHNHILLWWITKGFARAYGDHVVAHESDEIDVNNADDRQDFLETLESDMRTIH